MQQQIPPRLSTMRTTVGLRFLYEYMFYDKEPINIDEQLTLLQNRDLIIDDIATAKLQLSNIGSVEKYWGVFFSFIVFCIFAL